MYWNSVIYNTNLYRIFGEVLKITICCCVYSFSVCMVACSISCFCFLLKNFFTVPVLLVYVLCVLRHMDACGLNQINK